ncbi:copper chaperone PCu(A)C [Nocardiopsis sp. RSe5-2]|uniref:Copper chaperone PCu(A)C n=1 Tax=Nocardiopsis endophytica TaxID=3018445 RepID=A0ABT4UBL6_9ACTN|nr:copper chaperone PCu(A)C [Nocardiopsis endophytica]MDA2814379.1 copper chaperone PCu(A)C [Nocardiopsis endophytica]
MAGRRVLTLSCAAGALALAAVTGCAAQEPQIETSDATVRVPLTPDVTSAYVTIENTGGADDTLIGADTAAADEVQMHENVQKDDGTTGMEERDEIPVKAGETVSFEPGKLHLMLMDPDELKAGETVALELRFEKSGTVEVNAEVEDVMGEGAKGGDMESMDDMDHGDMDH